MSAARASVIRGSVRRSIEASAVVPGDILLIEEGDTISADARLIQSTALQTLEAALTGESLPVEKQVDPVAEDAVLGDRLDMIFSGTAATYGRGKAVVTATGMQSEMGRIAGMLKEGPQETTPLQRELARVGKLLGKIVIVIAIVMVVTIVLVEHLRGFEQLLEALVLGVALAVAAVPEGLPAVVTAVLALGVQRMAKRNAIVRHLAAVETLGSPTVIASDKTGTLTQNEMTVRTVVTASGRVEFSGTGYAPEGEVRPSPSNGGLLEVEIKRALAVGDRANNAALEQRDGRWTAQGDPTEAALLVAARKAGLTDEALDARFARVAEVPFSSERKLMSTVHTDAEKQDRVLVFTKGAPDVLLGRCSHELVGTEMSLLNDTRRARDPEHERAAGRQSAAHARCRLSLAARGRVRGRRRRRARGARTRVRGTDRYDRPAALEREASRRSRQGGRDPPDHDDRGPSGDCRRDRVGARHCSRGQSNQRVRARKDVRRNPDTNDPSSFGLRAREPASQAHESSKRCSTRARSWRSPATE